MQKVFVLLVSLLVFGCGGSSPKTPENAAPQINLASTQTAQSGDTITLQAQVSDPDGDSLTLNWQTDRQDIEFSDITTATTSLTLPEVNTDQTIDITLTATDSKGKLSQKALVLTIKALETPSRAPLIALADTHSAKGGLSVVLSAIIKDPDGDAFTLEWQADRDDIIFSDTTSLTPTLSLPEVSQDSIVTVTLIATDSQQNQSQRSLVLTIMADESEPAPNVVITIADRFEVISGEPASIPAIIYSSVDITGIEWELSALTVTDSQSAIDTLNNKSDALLTFTAPTVEQRSSYPITLTVNTSQGSFSAETLVDVVVDDSASLVVSLPEQLEIKEATQSRLTPVINNSHPVDSYQWRWLSDPQAQLLTPNEQSLTFVTPEVTGDTLAELELTVTMGDLTKVVTTTVLVGNVIEITDVNVTANHLSAVKGKNITFNVITDNLEQITDWSWRVIAVDEQYLTQSINQLEIRVPDDLKGQLLTVVTYQATLADGSEVTRHTNIKLLAESSARASFDIATERNLVVTNNTETTILATFTDPFDVSDSITLVQPFTVNTFETAELTRTGDQLEITLLTNTVDVDHIDVIHLEVAFGDYRRQHPIYLNMKVNN